MSRDKIAAMMDEWRIELQDTQYFKHRGLHPLWHVERRALSREWVGRVAKRLKQRGWLLKQIGLIWGEDISTIHRRIAAVRR